MCEVAEVILNGCRKKNVALCKKARVETYLKRGTTTEYPHSISTKRSFKSVGASETRWIALQASHYINHKFKIMNALSRAARGLLLQASTSSEIASTTTKSLPAILTRSYHKNVRLCGRIILPPLF